MCPLDVYAAFNWLPVMLFTSVAKLEVCVCKLSLDWYKILCLVESYCLVVNS